MPVNIVTVGIDLAKNVFAVHGVNGAGKPELVRPDVKRVKLLELIAALPPCLIGMEACSGAHYWARKFEKFGHTVRIMAPKFVAPYLLSELGFIFPQSFKAFHQGVHAVLEDLPGYCNQVIGELMNELGHLQERIAKSERQIQQMAKEDVQALRLM